VEQVSDDSTTVIVPAIETELWLARVNGSTVVVSPSSDSQYVGLR